MHNLFDLAGQTALVTGASGHVGRAIAEGLAEAGARLVVTSRSLQRAQLVAESLPRTGQPPHLAIELDQLDDNSIAEGFKRAIETAGTIDILINNAHQPTLQTWTNATSAGFAEQLANATGYFLLARLLRDHVVERAAPGSIIMLGSMYGMVGAYPAVYEGIGAGSPVAYQVLKGGIIQMTRHLAVNWAADRVRVNTLSPGPCPDPNEVPAELIERLCQKSPLGRIGSTDELKGPAVFLASRASSYVTGQNLVVDGGWTAW